MQKESHTRLTGIRYLMMSTWHFQYILVLLHLFCLRPLIIARQGLQLEVHITLDIIIDPKFRYQGIRVELL